MARYIDADALLQRLPDDLPYKASVKRVLIQAPTADVATRIEVETDIFSEIEKHNQIIKSLKNSKRNTRRWSNER